MAIAVAGAPTGAAVAAVPSNDLRADATPITVTRPGYTYADAVPDAQLATVSAEDVAMPHACTGPGSSSLWWSFLAPHSGLIDVDTAGSTGSHADTVLSVYTVSPGSSVEVECEDDGAAAARVDDVPVVAGATYLVVVSRPDPVPTSDPGTVGLQLVLAPDPAIAVSAVGLEVDEDGRQATYEIGPTTAPATEVTVTVAGDADCTVAPVQLAFTLADWAPRTITIAAPDDGLDSEGQEVCTITHLVTTDDPDYAGLVVPDVTALVSDHLEAVLSLRSPADGSRIDRGAVVLADYACTDNRGGAGIASCSAPAASGAAIDTSTVGAHAFTVVLTDVLGRTQRVTHTYTVTAPAIAGRPDVRARARAGRLVGDDVRGTGQVVRARVRAGAAARYTVSAQNDAGVSDRLRLVGGHDRRGFTVRYRVGGRGVTAAVVRGRFLTPTLAPGDSYRVTVLVRATRRSERDGRLATTVRARSARTPSATDAVRLVTRRR